MLRTLLYGLSVTALAAITSLPAQAQKSKDTLRLTVNDPFAVLSPYCASVDEAANFFRRVYGTLIAFDERNQKAVPNLAKSWTRVNPSTLEFELAENITFHNGNKFDADDVVSTLQYLSDTKYPFPNKERYTWITKVDKLGSHKVRVIAAEPNSADLSLLGYRVFIQSNEAFDPLENKCDYGRVSPVGTGPYKVVSLDKNDGLLVERFDQFKGDKNYFRAPITRVRGLMIPDPQTQLAQLITGGVDMVRNVTPDNAQELVKSHPNLRVSTLPSGSFIYLLIDAAGRSNLKPLTDPRVRKAIWMAIDRDTIIKNIVPGGPQGVAEKMMKLCLSFMLGCDGSNQMPSFDPAGAKKLLAEAGYPNGFSLTYDVFAPIKYIGEAIAGDLLKVGIKAAVNPVTIAVYRKKQTGGEINMLSLLQPMSGHPDMSNIADVFFTGPRDYAQDSKMHELIGAASQEFDSDKRKAVYKQLMDRNNEQFFVMGVTSVANNYAHTSEIEVKPNLLSPNENYIDDYFWK